MASPLLIITYSAVTPYSMIVVDMFMFFITMALMNTNFGTYLYTLCLLLTGKLYPYNILVSPVILHAVSLLYIAFTNMLNNNDNNKENGLFIECYVDGLVKSPYIANETILNIAEPYFDDTIMIDNETSTDDNESEVEHLKTD